MNPNLNEEPLELDWVKFSRIERPQQVFFYKQKDVDGDVIEDSPMMACHQQEAGMFGQFHKLMGIGDGVAYYNSLKTAKVQALCKKCQGAKFIEQAQNTPTGVQMVKVACEPCGGMGSYEASLKAGMVISIQDARRILREAEESEWNAANKDVKNIKKPKYDNRSFDSTVLQHENSDEIMNSFGRKSQPKPWKIGE